MRQNNRSFFFRFYFVVCSLFGLMFTFSTPTSALSKEISLSKKKVSLYINEGYQIKIQGKQKGWKVSFKSSHPSICSVSKKGYLKAKEKGSATISIKIEKNNKSIRNLKCSVVIDDVFLATDYTSLASGLKKNPDTLLLKPKKETTFKLPKGAYSTSLKIDGGSTKQPLKLILPKGSSLREIKFLKGKELSFQLEGKLAQMYLLSQTEKVTIQLSGTTSSLSALYVKDKSEVHFTSKKTSSKALSTKIYLSSKSKVKIGGASSPKVSVFLKDGAAESEIESSKFISYYANVPSTLVLKKGAEKTNPVTLNYKVYITVKNDTDTDISVTTPSLLKSVPSGETKTISGKQE